MPIPSAISQCRSLQTSMQRCVMVFYSAIRHSKQMPIPIPTLCQTSLCHTRSAEAKRKQRDHAVSQPICSIRSHCVVPAVTVSYQQSLCHTSSHCVISAVPVSHQEHLMPVLCQECPCC
eukprot:1136537-Pelagomonas_calceolata.AAC.12